MGDIFASAIIFESLNFSIHWGLRLAPDLAGLLEGLDIFLGHVYFGRNFIPELWYIAYAAGQF